MTPEPNEHAPPAAAPDDPVGAPADDDLDDPAHGAESPESDAEAEAEQVAGDGAGTPGTSEQPASGAAEQTAMDADFTPEQIDALVAERDEFLDAYRRTAADFDNFRKLSQKRLADEVARSQGAFVERMLPVLDAIDAARSHGGDDRGVEALAGALFGFLEKEGLERVHPVDEAFDPNLAEAVVHEPGDHEHPVVSEVLRTGYLWQGRVIRPAMVKVAG